MGRASIAPGILFGEMDQRLALLEDTAEHLTGAPELVAEVLSPAVENERRDREAKLKLYASHGVHEYWIVD